MNLPKSNSTLFLLVLGAGLAGGLLALRLATPPAGGLTADASHDSHWALPALAATTDANGQDLNQTRFASLRDLHPWGEDAPDPGAAQPPEIAQLTPGWDFSGVIEQGRERVMIFLDQTHKSHRVQAGDALPDGTVVSSIGLDSIRILRPGATDMETVCLYSRGEFPPQEPAP